MGESEVNTQLAMRVKGFRPSVQRAHSLLIIEGPGRGERFVLDGDEIVLGRGEKAAVVFISEEVSRQHARLTRIDEEYTIEDLGSRNGVRLNGICVHAAVLRDGDHLQLGDVFLTYREGA